MTKGFIACLTLIFCSFSVQADDYLLGDWGGKRSQWEEQGITVEAIVTNDVIANTSGGVKHDSAWLQNYDLTLALDTTKLGWWENGTFFFYYLGNSGAEPTAIVGDAQVASNIEAYSTAKLYEAWYEHTFLDGKLSLLGGLHDYNSEFTAMEYAGGLLNSSFGIGIDASQVGPSIFNTTALAVRAKIAPSANSYLLTALYDGIPGDPNNPRRTQIILGDDDGVFWGTEAGLIAAEGERYYKAAIGGWYHTATFEDFDGEERDSNGGLYALGELSLYQEEGTEQGLGAFLRAGFASGSRNQFDTNITGGLAYTGILNSRDEDVLSMGFAIARNSDDFRDTNPGTDSTETALELNYHIQLMPWFAVTPDVQYIINPGLDGETDNALVLGSRFELAL